MEVKRHTRKVGDIIAQTKEQEEKQLSTSTISVYLVAVTAV